MRITADERGSLTSPELFRPKMTFEASVEPDGVIRLVLIADQPVRIVKPRRIQGRLRGADISLDRETVAAAIRAERAER